MNKPDVAIRVTGQSCPLPLIELAKAVRSLQPGKLLQITGDDPVFEISVRDFCQAQNLQVVSVNEDNASQVSILIRC